LSSYQHFSFLHFFISGTEEFAQPKIGVHRNGVLAGDNTTNTLRWHADLLGQATLAQPHLHKQLLQWDFTRCDGVESVYGSARAEGLSN
jgi:hypothetical protein